MPAALNRWTKERIALLAKLESYHEYELLLRRNQRALAPSGLPKWVGLLAASLRIGKVKDSSIVKVSPPFIRTVELHREGTEEKQTPAGHKGAAQNVTCLPRIVTC